MSKCTTCSSDIYDFGELKLNLCWDCISDNESVINDNPDIAEIKENEAINDEDKGLNNKFSVKVTKGDGTVTVTELDKSKIEEKSKSSKPKKATTVSKKTSDKKKKLNEDDVDPVEPNEDTPIVDGDETGGDSTKGDKGEKPKPTTTKPAATPAPKPDEEGQKLIRESKEMITKASRAKTRAFSLINQALKETAVFEVSATADGKRMTVASIPYKDKNIDDILMTTTMEVLDTDTTNNKKKR